MRVLFLALILPQALLAVNWLVLPARVSLIRSQNQGARIFNDRAANSRAIALAALNYLQLRAVPGFLDEVPDVAVADSRLNDAQLRKIADESEASRFLLSEVSMENGRYLYQTSIYYRESGLITDVVASAGDSLFHTVTDHLDRRFGLRPLPAASYTSDSTSDLTLLMDLSGAGESDINALGRSLAQSGGYSSIAWCGQSGTGVPSKTMRTAKVSETISGLSNLRNAGNRPRSYTPLLQCGRDLSRGETYLLVNGAPEKRERSPVRGLLRQINKRAKLIVLAGGRLSDDERTFWKEASADAGVVFRDIVYRNKVGLSDGRSFYIFKQGPFLAESTRPEPDEKGVLLPATRRNEFLPDYMVTIYEQTSGQKIISRSVAETIIPLNHKSGAPANTSNPVRILLENEGLTFWVSVRSDIFRKSRPASGEIIYLMTEWSLRAPLQNNPDLVRISRNASTISESLLARPAQLISNAEVYRNRSLAGRSIYAVYGKVLEVRYPEAGY